MNTIYVGCECLELPVCAGGGWVCWLCVFSTVTL